MDFIMMSIFLCVSLIFRRGNVIEAAPGYNVIEFGAIGDRKTDNTQAFQKTWKNVCEDDGKAGIPTLVVPNGNFLLMSSVFEGPCKSNHVQFQLNGNIEAPELSGWKTCPEESWMGFSNIEGLIIDGNGLIDGHGSGWWNKIKGSLTTCQLKPKALHFHNCNNFYMGNIRMQNSPKAHISINQCDNVTVSNITVTALGDSPNTDGIDLSVSTRVNIKDSFIGTGDDCIAINGGCSNINITSLRCGPGHGISVGSLGKNGARDTVEEIHVRGCIFNGTQNGARIKTWEGGQGYARKISFEDITLVNAENPIIIDQHYDAVLVNGASSAVEINDVTFRRFNGTSATEEAIKLICSQVRCKNVILDHVTMTSSEPKKELKSTCINAEVRATATTPSLSCSTPGSEETNIIIKPPHSSRDEGFASDL